MKKVGLGLIGCSGRVHGLTQQLHALGKKIEVVALCDRSEHAVRKARETLNPEATAYKDYRRLVRDPRVDWVFVGTWNRYHKRHTVAALRAGKDVFCEKPLATTIADCIAMKKAHAESGRRLIVGFSLRYSPHYRAIKKLLDQDAVGDIITMEFNETISPVHGGFIMGNWRRFTKESGGHLLEKCCHDIDLVNWLTGSVAARVASFGGHDFYLPKNSALNKPVRKGKKKATLYTSWRAGEDPFNCEKDIVDNQVAIIEFANGVRATFHANCNAGITERRMYILGTKGTIRADIVAGTIELFQIGLDKKPRPIKPANAAGGHGGGDPILVQSLAKALTQGADPITTVDDGVTSAVTALCIDRAMRTGRVVSLAPVWKRAGVKMA